MIVAVPFITITEQNAGVYRGCSTADPAAPAWCWSTTPTWISTAGERGTDHRGGGWLPRTGMRPFIVTTTVQLFESLFGRTRIADAQAAPPGQLGHGPRRGAGPAAPPAAAVADALRILSEHFGATVVLSSATQPEMWGALFPDIRPARSFRTRPLSSRSAARVRYEWRTDPRNRALADVVAEAPPHPRALVVVNTVRDARTALKTARTSGGQRRDAAAPVGRHVRGTPPTGARRGQVPAAAEGRCCWSAPS